MDEKFRAFDLVEREYDRASRRRGAFASPHEGYAVILEELDELWDQIKGPRPEALCLSGSMRDEAVQVAAMAIRFIVDCCPDED